MQLLLKDDRPPERIIVIEDDQDRTGMFSGIRCPRCGWRPSDESRWACDWPGTPEPRFHSCGTVWNTFSTRGRCPECGHQWQWTSCLRCGQWSLHEDWYEPTPTPT
jgi:DNA-directed RNA polymerase subunit RPC12/RpoP